MRKPRKPRAPRAPRTPGSTHTTLGAAGGGDLAAAAEEIADGARLLAASWAKTGATVASIGVEVSGNTAIISADSGAAYPNETGADHPLFARGDRSKWTWRGKNGQSFSNLRPFLSPALDQRSGAAMARYAKKIDAMCRSAGFS